MAAGEITPDEALTITRVLDGRRRALQSLVLERRLDAEAAQAPADAETVAADRRDAGVDGDTPNSCSPADQLLQSACISPSPATIRGIVATLPVEERRLLAALIRQRRAAAGVAAAPEACLRPPLVA
jgi:hypothetical protein